MKKNFCIMFLVLSGIVWADIAVSRYGYWLFQPLKMAYAVVFPGEGIPKKFAVHSTAGDCVFSGTPVLMQTPWNVFTPANRYPGEKVYALNFSAFNRSGQYFIRIPGMRDSPVFTIRGPLPVPASTLPDAGLFDAAAGIFPATAK